MSKFFLLLLFISNIVLAQDYPYITFDEKDYKKCTFKGRNKLTLSKNELEITQGNFNGCYGASILVMIQFEINQELRKRNEKEIKLSLSDAFCKGSSYAIGGFGPSFFLSLMLGRENLCLSEDEGISHETALLMLKRDISCNRKDILDTSEFEKILKKIVEENSCKNMFILPPMQMHLEDGKDDKKILTTIQSAINQGHIVNIGLKNHQTNIVGYTLYECVNYYGGTENITLFDIQDPNGLTSEMTGTFLSSGFLDEIVQHGDISFLEIVKERPKDLDLILGGNKLLYALGMNDPESHLQYIEEVINELISSGGDINKKAIDGNTPLEYATLKNYSKIVNLIRKVK